MDPISIEAMIAELSPPQNYAEQVLIDSMRSYAATESTLVSVQMRYAEWCKANMTKHCIQRSQSHADILAKIERFRTQHEYGKELRGSVLAVAQSAAAFVEAGEYDDLAELFVALKQAVKEWRG